MEMFNFVDSYSESSLHEILLTLSISFQKERIRTFDAQKKMSRRVWRPKFVRFIILFRHKIFGFFKDRRY